MPLSEQVPLNEIPDGLVDFVDGTLLAFLTSAGEKTIWCAEWRDHPDAVHRLAAMADQWEESALGGTVGLHSFFRDVLDYHLPFLVDAEKGAFRGCKFDHAKRRRLDHIKPNSR